MRTGVSGLNPTRLHTGWLVSTLTTGREHRWRPPRGRRHLLQPYERSHPTGTITIPRDCQAATVRFTSRTRHAGYCERRLRVLRIYPALNQKTAVQFVDYVLERLPFYVQMIQTDNGGEFGSSFHYHVLDKGVGHRSIKARTPRLNGKVCERDPTASTARSSTASSTAP